jgi:hypothetical protein
MIRADFEALEQILNRNGLYATLQSVARAMDKVAKVQTNEQFRPIEAAAAERISECATAIWFSMCEVLPKA